jgi:predicted lipoprotein with Yx(FWY)xxD motif
MRTLVVLAGLLTVAALLAPASMAAGSESTVVAHNSRYGTILFDGRGFVLYGFTHDPRGKSACYGACAKAWPPYIVSARPKAGSGVTGRIGTTRRRDGRRQATLGGRPLYYYVGDRRPGDIFCQNVEEFGGLWLVVRPSGRFVR